MMSHDDQRRLLVLLSRFLDRAYDGPAVVPGETLTDYAEALLGRLGIPDEEESGKLVAADVR